MKAQKPRSGMYALLQTVTFKKNGPLYIGLTVLIVAAAVALYLLAGVLNWLDTPLRTQTAVLYETDVGVYTTGYIVRQEAVLASDCAITSLALAEGQKTAAGQTVAMGYATGAAQERQAQIAKSQELLAQLRYAGEGAVGYEKAALDAEIRTQLVSAAAALRRGDTAAVTAVTPKLKGMVLRASADDKTLEDIRARAASLEQEIGERRAQAGSDTQVIAATSSGYFSGMVDGFESVLTPERLESLSVAEFDTLSPLAVPAGALGKLITGDVWYYVTTADEESIADLSVGTQVTVSFAHDLARDLPMTVSHISQAEGGKCLLALSCDRYMQEVTMMRSQSANVTFATYSGLRVPKQAVRVDEGQPGVFVLENTAEKWKPVEILYDNGETYIVALDRSSTSNLWPGDEIIIDEKDVYNGKVVLQ
ncbi:MAG: hypothetical protein IJT18_07520 [Oscillospiraceae bacterium]|nr:hypothetical protein [Oscillospiraceae bacterium]